MADYTPKATISLKSKASLPTTSLDQQRAAYAWQCVQNLPKDYDKLAKGAPALIMNNGLMQALAFYQDKGKTKEGVMDRYHALNAHLRCWLGRQLGGTIFHQSKGLLLTPSCRGCSVVNPISTAAPPMKLSRCCAGFGSSRRQGHRVRGWSAR